MEDSQDSYTPMPKFSFLQRSHLKCDGKGGTHRDLEEKYIIGPQRPAPQGGYKIPGGCRRGLGCNMCGTCSEYKQTTPNGVIRKLTPEKYGRNLYLV